MTYNVFGGMLNVAQSVHSSAAAFPATMQHATQWLSAVCWLWTCLTARQVSEINCHLSCRQDLYCDCHCVNGCRCRCCYRETIVVIIDTQPLLLLLLLLLLLRLLQVQLLLILSQSRGQVKLPTLLLWLLQLHVNGVLVVVVNMLTGFFYDLHSHVCTFIPLSVCFLVCLSVSL